MRVLKDTPFVTEVICPAQAGHFYEGHMENFWEVNRVDGYSEKDLLQMMIDADHMGSFVDGKLIAVTKYEADSFMAELHTYIDPKYRLMATEVLKKHVEMIAKDNGCRFIFTATSNYNKNVFNFLRKRMGFTCYSVDLGCKITRDGNPVYVYKMMLEV